jgi:hypothetical protein
VPVGNPSARSTDFDVAPVAGLALFLQEVVVEHLQVECTADQHAEGTEISRAIRRERQAAGASAIAGFRRTCAPLFP